MIKFLVFLLLFPLAIYGDGKLEMNSARSPVEQLHPSTDFSVTVTGTRIFTYFATVQGPFGRGQINSSFVHVTLPVSGVGVSLDVAVAHANTSSPLTSARLCPRGSPVVSLKSPSTVSFSITTPGYYILELDGEFNVSTLDTGLMVFAHLEDVTPPSPEDPSVVYFAAGVHAIAGGVLTLKNDSTVYLAQDAVVLGRVEASNVHNATLRGTGILAAEWLPGAPLPPSVANCTHCGCPGNHAIDISNSTDVAVEGITVMHASSWMVKFTSVVGATVRGLQVIGWRCNNDGVDVVSSENVLIEHSFIRSADDAIAIKGLVTTQPTHGIVVRDSILFPHGNCMEIGFELWNDAVYNVTFERNICLHQMMNVFSIHNGGHAAVSGVTYRDILIEGLAAPPNTVSHDQSYGLKVLDLQISQGRYSGPDMLNRGTISDVVYSNITYRSNGLQWIMSRMMGNSTTHGVSRIHFDDFTINGSEIRSLADLNTLNNSFVSNVTFS
eukprot:m.82379 g.82379  ORF g.82379 m.82379 type:complete len:496 (-) comp25512_c0_seq1:161-1648(-)